jgi:hypothetical protein
VAANRIAKFDGTNWTALGTGLSSLAYGLLSYNDGSGPALYASGAFTTAGGVSCSTIAKWAGGAWSPLGAGLSAPVGSPNSCRAMAAYPTPYGVSIFAGGAFAFAGSIPINAPNCAVYGPTAPFTVTPPASQTVNAGANVSFSVVAGGQGNSYQWQHNGGAIAGATSATLNLTAVTPLEWGTYDCVMTNACGTSTSPAATLTLNPAFNLSMTQPFGPLSLFLTHSSPSQPGAWYLTTFSFDPLNGTNPGQGPWAGMYVGFQDIVNQFLLLVPPWVGTLDGGGNAGLIIPSLGLPLSLFGVQVCAVSMTFNPSPISLINNSNLQLLTIQ